MISDIQEEEDGEISVNKSVLNAELPPTSMKAFDRECEKFYLHHGDSFRSFEEAQYFFMLPLSTEKKLNLLKELTKTK